MIESTPKQIIIEHGDDCAFFKTVLVEPFIAIEKVKLITSDKPRVTMVFSGNYQEFRRAEAGFSFLEGIDDGSGNKDGATLIASVFFGENGEVRFVSYKAERAVTDGNAKNTVSLVVGLLDHTIAEQLSKDIVKLCEKIKAEAEAVEGAK